MRKSVRVYDLRSNMNTLFTQGAAIISAVTLITSVFFTDTTAGAFQMTAAVLLGVAAFFAAIWLLMKAVEWLISILIHNILKGRPPCGE